MSSPAIPDLHSFLDRLRQQGDLATVEVPVSTDLEVAEIPAEDTDGYREPTTEFIDGTLYDGKKPLESISSFEIGLKDES